MIKNLKSNICKSLKSIVGSTNFFLIPFNNETNSINTLRKLKITDRRIDLIRKDYYVTF